MVRVAGLNLAAVVAGPCDDPIEGLVGERVRLGVSRRRGDVARARALRRVVAEAVRIAAKPFAEAVGRYMTAGLDETANPAVALHEVTRGARGRQVLQAQWRCGVLLSMRDGKA